MFINFFVNGFYRLLSLTYNLIICLKIFSFIYRWLERIKDYSSSHTCEVQRVIALRQEAGGDPPNPLRKGERG